MSVNRNALIRYMIIDKCLATRTRRWTWKDILNEVNRRLVLKGYPEVGKTTVFEDLKDMQDRVFKAPIEKYHMEDKKTVYMRYSDPEYSIQRSPISIDELELLRSSAILFSRLRGLPQFDWLNEIIPRLESNLGFERNSSTIISFQSNLEYSGTEHIQAFFHGIRDSKVLKVTYRDFKSATSKERIFHPYHLRQHNLRWFVFGYDPKWTSTKYINMALDRVISIVETELPYRNDQRDWDDLFHDVVGVSGIEGKPVDVRIRIMDEEQMKYILTKPLHHSQKPIRKSENGQFETSIHVVPNYELMKLLMSYGSRIKVLSPRALVEQMRANAVSMASHYADATSE